MAINSRISPWLTPLVYRLAVWLVLPLYFKKITIRGQENIPQQGPVIIAPTHRSRWDAIIVPYATGKLVSGRHPRFMVTSTEIKGLQGWLIRNLGGFPVDLERPGLGSFEHSLDLLLEGEMLVIFPEGGIFQDDQLHPLKRGVSRIALEVLEKQPESTIQILPLQIKYSHYPVTWGTEVEVAIAPPLSVVEYQTSSARQSSLKLTAALSDSLVGHKP